MSVTNCPNCGAPYLTIGASCDYCGTPKVYDETNVDYNVVYADDKPIFIEVNSRENYNACVNKCLTDRILAMTQASRALIHNFE